MERIVRWYDEAFGAKPVFHAPREGDRQELIFLEFHKGQYIEIFTDGKPRADQAADTIGYQHFCLIVDDIDDTLKHLAAMNVQPQRPPREGRSHTGRDDDGNYPDALDQARELDRYFARTGKFAGPLHGIPIAIKDNYDTFDMRTTAAAAAEYADDRPADDATMVAKLRAAGAILLGKTNMDEYAPAGIARAPSAARPAIPTTRRGYPGDRAAARPRRWRPTSPCARWARTHPAPCAFRHRAAAWSAWSQPKDW